MRVLSVLIGVVAGLVLLLPAGVAFGQVPPGPTTVLNDQFEAASVPGPIDIVHVVLDFPPGSGVPMHTHGGQAFISMLEGVLTLSGGGTETTYRAGDTFIENPGEVFAATNPTAGNARLFATYVLPKGAPQTSVQPGMAAPAIGPTTVAQGRFEIASPPPQFEVVQVMLDFPTGVWTPPHTHGGPVLVTVVQGQVTERRAGIERRFGAGEGWTENEGDLHAAGNDAAATARVAASFLLRKGSDLTTVQAASLGPAPAAAPPGPAAAPARPAAAPPAQIPAQLPRTGELPLPGLPAELASLALLAGGVLLRTSARARSRPRSR